MHISNLVKFCQFVLKILSGNKILELIKGHNSGRNMPKMKCNDPKLDLVNMNAYIKFGEILSICSQDIERKWNYDRRNDIRNSGTNMRKMTRNNPKVDLVNMNAYIKFL